MKVCRNIPNLRNTGWKWKVKSVKMPEALSVKIFEKHLYNGSKVSVEDNLACIKNEDYAFL